MYTIEFLVIAKVITLVIIKNSSAVFPVYVICFRGMQNVKDNFR